MYIYRLLICVTMFILKSKWMELFPAIVSRVRTIEVISSGVLGSHSDSLQLVINGGLFNYVYILVVINCIYCGRCMERCRCSHH